MGTHAFLPRDTRPEGLPPGLTPRLSPLNWGVMGLTHIEGTVAGPAGKEATLKFLVDSGATYTVLPYKIWRAIRLKGTDTVTCTLADGTEVKRKASDCYITLPQGQRQTPVILGEKDDEALLAWLPSKNSA